MTTAVGLFHDGLGGLFRPEDSLKILNKTQDASKVVVFFHRMMVKIEFVEVWNPEIGGHLMIMCDPLG